MKLRVKRTDPAAVLPAFAYPGDAGVDLTVIKSAIIQPGAGVDLSTGLRIELPVGHWGRITGRSSTLRKRGFFVNEGIIDNGYRGELFVYAFNPTDQPITVEAGARLAQLIVAPIVDPVVVEVEELSESARGDKGFGSSGLS
jgi:dUTP pyrophosphatase